ncbi:MAG TPA: lipid kinase, partial [Burkholderiales bacterium]|nr:lipid kinase [Burkholderiales bacterium]
MGKRALLIVNEKSRAADRELSEGVALLKASGLALIRDSTSAIADSIRHHRNSIDLVILGGGDGTLHSAASALVEAKLPLGIVPLGTANDLARTLAIPQLPLEAFRVIAQGRLREIDVGKVNGIYFFNVANIGLGVGVTRELSSEIKRRWGVLAYSRGVARALKAHRPFSVRIICDGASETLRTIQVAVGNGRHYGGGMTIDNQAQLDDSLLHVYSVEPTPWWRLAGVALALKHGRPQNAIE